MNKSIFKIGFWSAIFAFSFMIIYFIVQVLQLARLLLFPFDEYFIYGSSLCIAIPFLLAILALHYVVAADKKFWSHASLIFSSMYAVFVITNYITQLATVIPAKLAGDVGGLRILDQSPHSLFWNFDALGYIFMGIATFAAIPVFEKRGFAKWVRVSFLANALVTPLISIVYFYRPYSEKLLLLGLPWVITAPLSVLALAVFFRKALAFFHTTHDNNHVAC